MATAQPSRASFRTQRSDRETVLSDPSAETVPSRVVLPVPQTETRGHHAGKVDVETKRWKRTTIILSILLGIFIAVSIALLVVVIIKIDNVCTTPACVLEAASIISAINFSVNPCEDFYQYACGSWISTHLRKKDYNQFKEVIETVQSESIALLEEQGVQGENAVFTKAKTLYASCMDIDTIRNESMAVLKPLLRQMGGWPVLDSFWNENTFSLEDTLVKVAKYTSVFINTKIVRNPRNVYANIIALEIVPPSFGKESFRLGLTEEEMLESFFDRAMNMVIELGASADFAEEEMKNMVEFEAGMAEDILSEVGTDTAEFSLTTISEWSELYPQFNWLRFLSGLYQKEGVTIDAKEPIQVLTLAPMKKIVPFLATQERRVIANYVMWRLCEKIVQILSSGTHMDLLRPIDIKNTTMPDDRKLRCLKTVQFCLRSAATRIFIQKHVSPDAKKLAERYVQNIRPAMIKLISRADWLDEPTRNFALKKMEHLSRYIAYDSRIEDDAWLASEYKSVSFRKTTFYENILSCLQHSKDETYRNLRQRFDSARWASNPLDTNAYYNRFLNGITIIFCRSRLFGSFGFVVGHETMHAFDPKGMKFDETGDLRNWWTNSSWTKYEKKFECLIDQYGNYTLGAQQVNGTYTLAENVADAGGMQASFLAFQEWKEANDHTKLPGMDYTLDQLFFLAFAQIWCSVVPEDKDISDDLHSPNAVRVLGVLSNSKDFAKAFKCPLGSKMNPHNKCSMW